MVAMHPFFSAELFQRGDQPPQPSLEERRKPSEDLFKWLWFEDLKPREENNNDAEEIDSLADFELFEGSDDEEEDVIGGQVLDPEQANEEEDFPEQTQEDNPSCYPMGLYRDTEQVSRF